jgi:heat shock protein HslJ
MITKIYPLLIAVAALMPLSAKADAVSDAATDTKPVEATATPQVEQAPPKTKTVTHNAAKLLPGEWTIHSLRGERLTGEERPYIYLDTAKKRFYGSNGCNILNGDLTIAPSEAITFTNLISSRNICNEVSNQYMINTTLGDVRSYVLKKTGHEYYLELLDSRRHTVMVLRKHNMQFLDGAWRVARINGTTNNNEGVELVIDVELAHIHGNTGCNILNGSLFIDPDKRNSLQFIEILTTRAACDASVPETELLVALEEVESAYDDDSNTVTLYDTHNCEVLQLKRIHPTLDDN